MIATGFWRSPSFFKPPPCGLATKEIRPSCGRYTTLATPPPPPQSGRDPLGPWPGPFRPPPPPRSLGHSVLVAAEAKPFAVRLGLLNSRLMSEQAMGNATIAVSLEQPLPPLLPLPKIALRGHSTPPLWLPPTPLLPEAVARNPLKLAERPCAVHSKLVAHTSARSYSCSEFSVFAEKQLPTRALKLISPPPDTAGQGVNLRREMC